MSTPIFDALERYANQHQIRLHTPGHGGNAAPLAPFSQILPFDVTEIEGFDSLYDANGIIAQSEEFAAEVFGAGDTLFSSGGCTLAIQTMLAMCLSEGDAVAMSRNSHRSAVNTAALLGLNPVWMYPENDGVISPQTVEKTILNSLKSSYGNGSEVSQKPSGKTYEYESMKDCGTVSTAGGNVKAVYITSPDYYGRLCDVKGISRVCKKYNIPLLVDNAHGSHLAFLSQNLHPLHLGADYTACSAHKTLPVLTGGALLNIRQKGNKARAKRFMSIFGSTSPSYPIMASIELACHWLKKYGRPAFAKLEQMAALLRDLTRQYGLCPDFSLYDPVRITLHTGKIGVSGVTAATLLKSLNIQPEYYDSQYAVLILHPFLTEQDLSTLCLAIKQVAGCKKEKTSFLSTPVFPISKAVMSIRSAVFSNNEIINVSSAAGRIAAEAVCPCPPGIPAVIPGELIEKDTIDYLKSYGIDSIKVVRQNG